MNKIKLAFSSLIYAFLLFLPDEFSKLRVRYYNKKGCKIHKGVSISPNVRIRGRFEMGEGNSIAQNCSISGERAGVFIGKHLMIARNVVIEVFNHGIENIVLLMVKQKNCETTIIIEDDVWIVSNYTIVKGVVIWKESIIEANYFVNKNVPSFSIMGGVLAKLIKLRSSK